MELNFTVNTDEIYEREIDFESLLTDALTRSIVKKCKKDVAGDEFKKFSTLASDVVIADIKLRMENFLSEEITLTERYGEKTFVGSIEDLIKKRFDDVILRPVDGSGNTIQGCTSSGKTWIEWSIQEKLGKTLSNAIDTASSHIKRVVQNHVDKKLVEIKNSAIEDQVNTVFTSILNKGAK